MKLRWPVPLFVREIARDVAARRELSRLLAEAGKPPAGDGETLDALRARYRDACYEASMRANPGSGEEET